jgi:hypothetical protein
VRIGNVAHRQFQLGVLREVMDRHSIWPAASAWSRTKMRGAWNARCSTSSSRTWQYADVLDDLAE